MTSLFWLVRVSKTGDGIFDKLTSNEMVKTVWASFYA